MSRINWEGLLEPKNLPITPKYEILKLNIVGVITHEVKMSWSKKKEDWVPRKKKYKTPLIQIECHLQINEDLHVNQIYIDEYDNKWFSISSNILSIMRTVKKFSLPKNFMYLCTTVKE